MAWLTILTAVTAFVLGGHLEHVGFSLQVNVTTREILFTPLTMWRLPYEISDTTAYAVTLGGTTIMTQGISDDVRLYETKHWAGWQHYGLEYALRVFTAPCKHDPLAIWAFNCLEVYPDTTGLLPKHQAFSIRF